MPNDVPKVEPGSLNTGEASATLGRKIAQGAAWMVVMRWSVRAIGLVSAIVLARLLAPTDFGLVAMAMVLVGLLEVMGMFGFESIIIQRQTVDRGYYDTGWTLNILKGAAVGTVCALLAYPAARFYGEMRLVPVILVFALSSFLGGFENIGTVDFRKNLNFRANFLLLSSKKAIAFIITVPLAFILRDYWALVLGTLASTIAGLGLGYAMAPYRPRLTLSKAREMFHFSKWMVTNEIVIYVSQQADTALIGKFINSQTLGYYEISKEVALLPNTELTAPITAALFAGYSRIKDDLPRLLKMFTDTLSLVLILSLPMTIGIALVAKNMVPVVLGDKWLPSIGYLELLAIWGCIGVGWMHVSAIFLALGKPRMNTFLFVCGVVPKVTFLTIGVIEGGAYGAIYGLIAAAALNYVVVYLVLRWHFALSVMNVVRIKWRILVALAMMVLAVQATDAAMAGMSDALVLVVKILVGALSYGAALTALWAASGRPDGAERIIVRELAHWAKAITA